MTLSALLEAQRPLADAYRRWQGGAPVDMGRLREWHDVATVAAHRHYAAEIPVYRKLAEELGLLDCDEAETIRAELASTDDTFKSYPAELLDHGDYRGMTDWIAQISGMRVDLDSSGLRSTADWLTAMDAAGCRVRFSSGTSGQLSFVPRDERTEARLVEHTTRQWEWLTAPDRVDLSRYDAFFLAFAGGYQAFASQGELLARLTRSATFLYDFASDPDTMRWSVLGAPDDSEAQERLRAFRREAVDRLPERYGRILDGLGRTSAGGRPTFMYASPFQLLDLCRIMEERGESMPRREESILLTGGGWKSFEGERIARSALIERACERLGFDPGRTYEGYGQTECNVHFQRCGAGRFHVPPLVLPMVLDDALYPIEGDGVGRYAFSDPFALSYPGFFISGDQVDLRADSCSCGITGYTIAGEISRAPGHEVKGCGGVMAAMRA
jgi:hypothetical protein